MTLLDDDLEVEEEVVEEELVVARSECIGSPKLFTPIYLGPVWKRGDDGKFILPKHTLGWDAIAWAMKWLRGADGTDGWTFTMEQVRLLLWFYAVDERGRWVYRDTVLQLIKGSGKDPIAAVLCAIEFLGPCRLGGWQDADGNVLDSYQSDAVPIAIPVKHESWIQIVAVSREQPLALTTLVPTPQGPVKMGDLHVGDEVFGADGRPVRVARETEVFVGLECYKLTFDDGTEITASASHGWTVDHLCGKGAYASVTMSTEEMYDRYQYANGTNRVRIPLVERRTPDVQLPIDPYILGIWLGDGAAASPNIASGQGDADELVGLLTAACPPSWEARRTDVMTWSQVYVGRKKSLCPRGHDRTVDPVYTNGFPGCRRCREQRQRRGETLDPVIPSMHELLKKEGLIGSKRVPEAYLVAGTEQRRALLQGLLDSDGCMTLKGRVMFTNTNRNLIDAVVELARSLGYKPFVRDHSTAGWNVSWLPVGDQPLFRLSRKVVRQTSNRKAYRILQKMERVESVPVKCIGIDTPDHLFLVETGVLTHNTKNTMMYLQGLFTKDAISRFDIEINKQIIYADGSTRRIEVQTSAPRSLEGNRPSFVVGNEPHHWIRSNDGHEVKKVVDRNLNKMRGPQMKSAHSLWITNAYDPAEDSVAQRMREAYEQQIAKGPTRTLWHSIEAPEDVALMPEYTRVDANGQCWIDYDPAGIPVPPNRAAVLAHMSQVLEMLRGDAVWLDPEETVDEILKPDNPIEDSRRFYLNSIVTGSDAYLRDDDIRATIHPQMKPLREGMEQGDVTRLGWSLIGSDEPIVMFFDGSKSDDSTALVGCRVSDGYFFLIGLWEKPRGSRGLTWLSPREAVDARVDEAFARFKVAGFWADPSHTKDDRDGSRYWDGLIDGWHLRHSAKIEKKMWAVQSGEKVSAIMWDMATPGHQENFSQEVVRFADEMDSQNCSWDGHPSLRIHLRNARRSYGSHGLIIRKPARGGTRKIDAAVCAIGAKMLARLAALKTEEDQKPSREIWW